MDSERKKKLLETMKSFNKNQKDSILDFGTSSDDTVALPTGIILIDEFLGGGTKRGTFTVIYGGYSVGKSTLVLQQIANLQKEGKICCYIDLEHSFDKTRAKQLGIDLDELILAEKCSNAEQALEIIRSLCKEKVVDYFAVDSIQAMSPLNEQENKGKERQLVEKEIAELARTLSKFFRVVAPDVFNAKASVVMIGQVRIHGIGTFFTRAGLTGGEALKHWANQMLFLRQGQSADAPSNSVKKYFLDLDKNLRYKTEQKKVGFDTVIKLEKTKSSESEVEGSEIHIPFVFDRGFVNGFESVEGEIEISGTDEEKSIINQELIKKGILQNLSLAESNPNITKESLEQAVISSTAIEDVKIEKVVKGKPSICDETLEDLPKTIISAKKRGRPKKEKK